MVKKLWVGKATEARNSSVIQPVFYKEIQRVYNSPIWDVMYTTAEFYQLLARLFQSYLLSSHFRLSLGIWNICYFKHHISVLLKKFAHPESFSHFDSDTTSDFYFIILYLFYLYFYTRNNWATGKKIPRFWNLCVFGILITNTCTATQVFWFQLWQSWFSPQYVVWYYVLALGKE